MNRAGAARSRVASAVAVGLLLWLTVFGAPTAGADPAAPPRQDQIEMRLRSVGRLIGQSSVSRRIEASGSTEALERRAQAREAYRRALEARDAGDFAQTERLLAESGKLMFEAARLADRNRVIEDKERADFSARKESVKSLLAAQRRISAEKAGIANAAETSRAIEELLGQADRRADAKQWPQAQAALNKAYLVAKAAVSSMRAGSTLVHSLNFATPEEEYRYELDRNDTHLMLVKVLAGEKAKLQQGSAMRDEFARNAAELRREAEKASAAGDYAGAIRMLEDSTRQLVREIRSLGVFIPG